MKRNIVLIGFMGTGKSTVGKKLAADLGWTFIDTDEEIEKAAGMKIPDIFKTQGEQAFREAERTLIQKLAQRESCVISTGGGTILDEGNRAVLSAGGYLIALHAPLETVLKRVGDTRDRPLLQKASSDIAALWQSRLPVYGRADYSIDTADKSAEQVKAEILVWLKEAE